MKNSVLEFSGVSYRYDNSPQPVFENISFSLSGGWNGLVGSNGAGKTTLMKLAAGLLNPGNGAVRCSDFSVFCRQRTEEPPGLFEDFIYADDGFACRLKGRLEIGYDWLYRWETLSHGERKRAQIGTALWQDPAILLLDEPFNHLDLATREMLLDSMKGFRGTGLLITHDRDILDTLCRQCLFIRGGRAVLRPGGYSDGMKEEERERESARKSYFKEKENLRRLAAEAVKRREQSDKKQRALSKKGLDPKDHDARARRDAVRVSGKDGTGGKLLRQMEGRISRSQSRLRTLSYEDAREIGISVPGESSSRRFLLTLPEGSLEMGDHKRLCYPSLEIGRDDGIALLGPNGAGKSTLIRYVLSKLDIPAERLISIPQEITEKEGELLLRSIKQLDKDRIGQLMAVVSRLGSDPVKILGSVRPSPGEVRKILLAAGILRQPYLIVMDEPTNHMDIDSVQCLESALQECPCAKLLVSHDLRFLQNLTEIRWAIDTEQEVSRLTVLR